MKYIHMRTCVCACVWCVWYKFHGRQCEYNIVIFARWISLTTYGHSVSEYCVYQDQTGTFAVVQTNRSGVFLQLCGRWRTCLCVWFYFVFCELRGIVSSICRWFRPASSDVCRSSYRRRRLCRVCFWSRLWCDQSCSMSAMDGQRPYDLPKCLWRDQTMRCLRSSRLMSPMDDPRPKYEVRRLSPTSWRLPTSLPFLLQQKRHYVRIHIRR